MRPVSWNELADLCASEGCKFDRTKGDHYIMTKPGLSRPIVIPKKKDLTEDIVLGVGRTLGIDRKTLESRLNSKGRTGKGGSS